MDTVLIPLSFIDPHPHNPRLVMREDVIDRIASSLTGGFLECYAVQLFEREDRFWILSGHHRVAAARKAGLELVPAYIRDDLTEEEAYGVLVTSNTQSELSTLEIGMHALHLPNKGKHGKGLTAYASMVGQKQSNVSAYMLGAEVACHVKSYPGILISDLLSRAKHLAFIHRLPREKWAEYVSVMLDRRLSREATAELVNSVLGKPKSQPKMAPGQEPPVMAPDPEPDPETAPELPQEAPKDAPNPPAPPRAPKPPTGKPEAPALPGLEALRRAWASATAAERKMFLDEV